MFGQSKEAVAVCIRNLKAKLAAVGFQVSAGEGVDIKTWQAISVLAGSLFADRIAGKGVTIDVQFAACNAIVATLAKQTPEAIRNFVFEQNKRLTGLPAPMPGVVVTPIPKGLVVAGAVMLAAAAAGLVVAFWPSSRA